MGRTSLTIQLHCGLFTGIKLFASTIVIGSLTSLFCSLSCLSVAADQVVKDEDGSVFMEEVQAPTPKAAPKKAPVMDFSSLGVPLDPKGRIVPIIQPEAGPVLRNTSRIEVEYTPPSVYVPYYSPFMAPYSIPQSTPYGVIPRTVFSNPLYGYFPVPMGLPQYFTSSSDDQPSTFNYQNSGTYYSYPFAFPSGNLRGMPYSGYPRLNGSTSPGLFSPYGPSSPFSTVAPFGGSPFSYFPSLGGFGGLGGLGGIGATYPWGPYAGALPPFAVPGANVWSPRWRSPWSMPLNGSFYLPQVTQFQQQGSITPLFPSNLDGD